MRRKPVILFTVIFLIVISFSISITASANVGDFSMSPVFPDNQNPETRGFFDLRVEAGTRQEISVAISNSGEEPINVSLTLVTASTNRNGIVNYTNPGISDETMTHSFDQIGRIAAGGELVTIPPGEAAIVPIYIDIPQEGFDGIILGSVRALLEITEEQRAEAGLIVNRFAHVIVVRLQERDTEIPTNFELGDVRADLVNHRASIVAEVRNTQPRLTMGALVHAEIIPAGAEEPIFSSANVSVDFAPNTIFYFSFVDEAGFGLLPGDYFARIRVEHGEDFWDFERNFEILPQQAEEINAAAVNIQQAPQAENALDLQSLFGNLLGGDILLLGGIGLLILAALITLIIVIIVRGNRRSSRKRLQEISNEELLRQFEQLGVNNVSNAQNHQASSNATSDTSSIDMVETKPDTQTPETISPNPVQTTTPAQPTITTPVVKMTGSTGTASPPPAPTDSGAAPITDSKKPGKSEDMKVRIRRKKEK